ncbi:MAG: acyl-CoA dehydrogenase [Gemmatales bacterium]|nr:MAG: acyl-CoA dehydrogenase [Gemmatales bacterium]
MNWKLDATGQELLRRAESIAEKVVAPAAAETDKSARFPTDAIAALRSAGLLGLLSSKEHGGQGQSLRTAVAVVERLARECPSTAMVVTMHYCAAKVIDKFGRDIHCRAIATEGKLGTLAFSEAGSRSHFWIPVSTAEKIAQGIKLNAEKQLITSCEHADFYVWSSRPVQKDGLSTIWVVPRDADGLTITAVYDGLGLRGNGSSSLRARNVVIPETNRLGEDGQGFDIMVNEVLPCFNLLSASTSLGMMEGVVAHAVRHVSSARYAHDGTSLADLPQVRAHVAKMRIKTDLLRGLLQDALDALEQQREEAPLRVLQAKAAGAELSLEVHDLAMRVCGGAAFRKDLPVERFFRDSRAANVMAPVTDALYDMIGKSICGLPVF